MAYTNIDDPSAHFQTATYTGTNATGNAITNDGNSDLQPDLIFSSYRTLPPYTNHRCIIDSSRGRRGILESDTTAAEVLSGVGTNDLESFDTNGFTVGQVNSTSSLNAGNTPTVAWQWKANGGTTTSNTDGDITSTVQVNQDAGFSIMTYAGTTGDVHTIGHGLGVTPDVWIVKQRSGNSEFQDWFFWHKDMAASNVIDNSMMFLNTSAAVATYTGINAVTSSTIRVKSSTTAQNGDTYVAYAFAEKQGYSKFGKYVGNGNANGPFVYLGFKPAFVMLKETTGAGSSWAIFDNKRSDSGFNVIDKELAANESSAEYDRTAANTDFLSNGFKIRNTDGWHNTSGDTYIYMAFAENPFTTSTGIPTTAR